MTEDEVATQREGADGRSPLPRSSPSAGVVLNAQALLQADGGEPGMVAIGDLEIRVLRFMLCGSTGGTSRYRRRLWASSTLVMALSVGWMVVAATRPEVIGPSKAFHDMGYFAALVWISCGWVATECTFSGP